MFSRILFLICFFISLNSTAHSSTKEHVLTRGNFASFAPPFVNKDYYLIEFGFVTQKKIKTWDYDYNAYVTAVLFEDWLDKTNKLRAGALGFKAGVIVPTQPWVPLLFTLSGGFAKSVLHKNPIIGKESESVDKKDMFLIEAGLLYHYNQYFVRATYQLSNVSYFKRHFILMLGVNY